MSRPIRLETTVGYRLHYGVLQEVTESAVFRSPKRFLQG